MSNPYVGKYVVILIKGNRDQVLASFDTAEEAIAWGDSHKKYYPLSKGIMQCCFRKDRYVPDFLSDTGSHNYYDSEIKTWFDYDEYVEYDNQRRKKAQESM